MRFDSKLERGLALQERADLNRLWTALSSTAVRPSRRDFLRWSAIAAGAVVTAREGVLTAAPQLVLAQDAPIVEGAEISVPFDAFGQTINLDPHRSSDYGGFWVMYPNV